MAIGFKLSNQTTLCYDVAQKRSAFHWKNHIISQISYSKAKNETEWRWHQISILNYGKIGGNLQIIVPNVNAFAIQFTHHFFKKNLEDMSLFVGTLIPLFWISSDVSSGFQSQSGQPYSCLAEVYVLHIPWDLPLVQHLQTSWQPAWQLSHLFHIPARHFLDSKPRAIMPPLTVWDQDALPTELSRLALSSPIIKLNNTTIPVSDNGFKFPVYLYFIHSLATFSNWRHIIQRHIVL